MWRQMVLKIASCDDTFVILLLKKLKKLFSKSKINKLLKQQKTTRIICNTIVI